MFSQDLQQQQPYATEIISASIQANRLHHCLMFEYGHPLEQYWLANEIAKILNCEQKTNNIPCGTCNNCLWISQNTHPAFITVSPVDLIVTDQPKALELWSLKERRKHKNDQSIINVRQARYIRKILSVTSSYYKVIVFTNAADDPTQELTYATLWEKYSQYYLPPKIVDEPDNQRFSWIPLPLTKDVMPEEMANTLLKTFEEPPAHVMFIFITRDHQDILNTIVSRCQVIPLLANIQESVPYQQEVMHFLNNTTLRTPLDALQAGGQFIDFARELSAPLDFLLSAFQGFCHNRMIQHLEHKIQVKRFHDFMVEIDYAKDDLRAYVNPKAVLEDLFLKYLKVSSL